AHVNTAQATTNHDILEPNLISQQAPSGPHGSWQADLLHSSGDTRRPITSDKSHSEMGHMNALVDMQDHGSVSFQDQEMTLSSKETPHEGEKRHGFMRKTVQKIKSFCGELLTASADKLMDHIKTPKKVKKCKKQTSAKLFKCDFENCIVTCKRKHDLKRHQMTQHSDEHPYSCDICGKRFQRTDKRNLHRNKNKCNRD
ncbi:hypothetical protein BG011_000425, partial [Mortierella polycephala]